MLSRVFDIIISLVELLVVLLMLPVMAVLIKLNSPNPVFYAGWQVGKEGKLFKMLKFRTMYETLEPSGVSVSPQGDHYHLEMLAHFYHIQDLLVGMPKFSPRRLERVQELCQQLYITLLRFMPRNVQEIFSAPPAVAEETGETSLSMAWRSLSHRSFWQHSNFNIK